MRFRRRPAGEIGGDYCDLLPIDNDRVAFALGDICGKGVPAALLMTSVYAAVRSHIELASQPAEMARAVNRLLCESTSPENYATSSTASTTARRAQSATRTAATRQACSTARTALVVQLDSTSTVVGLFQNAEYAELTVQAEPGDRLVLFSDGLPDSQPEGDDGWIARSVSMLAAASSASIAESLAAAAVNGSGEIDDVTILDLRFL